MNFNMALAELYGRADLNYYKLNGVSSGKSADTSSFTQSYSLGLTKQLTSTIMAVGEVRLTERDVDGKNTEDIYPVFYLNYTPPAMYHVSFSYNRSEIFPPDGSRYATSNTNASFSLPLEKWPSVTLSYNRSTTKDYLPVHKTDTETLNKNLTVSYGLSFLETSANLSYAYSNPITNDSVSNIKFENRSHLVSASLSRSFLDNKIRTGINAGYNQSEIINESLGAPTKFPIPVAASEGLYVQDTTPANGSLNPAPLLIDHNTGVPTGITLNAVFQNIGFRFSTPQAVNKIHLYISTQDQNIVQYINNSGTYFGWEAYSSSDGITWTLIGTPTATYDSAFSRIIFDFPETGALYFKVVNTFSPPGAATIDVTEVEGVGFLVSTPTDRVSYNINREFGGFNISYTPIRRLAISYNINYDHSKQALNNTDSTSINQGSSINLMIIPRYLNLITNYTISRTELSRETTDGMKTSQTGTDTYAFSLSSTPLPTLNATLNYGHSESVTDGEISSKTDSMNGNVFMNLYKGVNLGLSSIITQSESLQSNSTTDSQSYFANLSLVPWRVLTILINGGTTASTTETAGVRTSSTTSNLLATTISFTPTRKLYATATLNIEPVSSQSYSIAWLPTNNTQLALRYGVASNTTTMGADFSWLPISRLNLRIGYSGTRIDNPTNDRSDALIASASLWL